MKGLLRMHPSYDAAANALGHVRCSGDGGRCPLWHDLEGTYSRTGGYITTIHFSERPITKPNTLAFLKLVARAEDPDIDADLELWRRIYRLNVAVRELARELHIGNPAHPARLDRSLVLALVAGISNEVPMRKQAYDWARRGPKRKEE